MLGLVATSWAPWIGRSPSAKPTRGFNAGPGAAGGAARGAARGVARAEPEVRASIATTVTTLAMMARRSTLPACIAGHPIAHAGSIPPADLTTRGAGGYAG